MRTARSVVPAPQSWPRPLLWVVEPWASTGRKVMNVLFVKVASGRPQLVWLNTFWASMRISGRKRPTGNERNSPRSTFQTEGVRNWLRRLLPKPARLAPVGCENSDLSYQASVFEPAEPVGLGSPCTLIRTKEPLPQPGQLRPALVPRIENGVPEYADPMPLICQFLTIWPRTLLEFLAKGS